MYQALYRKWRPRTFDDVVGQEHITETLKKQVAGERLSHAYLFIGTRGTGKTSCAKILAKAVNCENPVNGNPCNCCRSCKGIDDGSVMDVVEMDAASNNGVDSVRALRDEAIFSPASVKKRVYIIDEVHMLSASAFNALLKILEEPPEHLMFILATTELHKVLPTILSRCQRHSFKRLDTKSIEKRLMYVAAQEKLDLRADAASLIAGLAEGGMRDALSMLDQCSGRDRIDSDTVYSAMGLAGTRYVCRMLEHIRDHDTPSAIALFTELWQNGKDPSTLLGELSSLMREILMRAVAPKGGRELVSGCYEDSVLASFAGAFSKGELVNNINIVQSAMADMKGGQARTICELCLITLCEPDLGDDLPLMRQRVAKLEQDLQELRSRPVTVVQQAVPILKAPHSSEEMHADFPFGVDEIPEQPIYGQPHSETDAQNVPPFDIDSEYDAYEEDEYVPDTETEMDEADELYYMSQLPPIPELPPLPGDPVSGSDYGDPRAALMSFSTQVPESIQPEIPPEEVSFDLDVPSFMREPEEEKPRAPVEIKRKIYFDEAAAPPEAKEDFALPVSDTAPAAPKAAAAPKPPVTGDGEIWEKTKAALSGNMPFGLYLLLTDPTQVEGFMQSGELILSVKSSFAMNMLNRPDIIAKVASVASSFAGRSVTARMLDADKAPAPTAPAAPVNTDKLDELGRFEIVSFK